MTKRMIELTTTNDVKEFVRIMGKCPKTGDIVAGRYIVDARSLMGIFSLDLSKPIELAINGDEDEVTETLADLNRFIVK